MLKRHCGGNNRPLVSFRGVKRRGNPLNRNENISGDCFSPHLFLQSLTAQAIRAISSSTDKNSSHSFAISLAWCMRLRRKRKNAICVLCTRADNCVRCDFLTSHVRIVRWVLIQAVPFSLCIDLSLFDHIYFFEDGAIPPSANLQSGLINAHSFEAYLYTESAHS